MRTRAGCAALAAVLSCAGCSGTDPSAERRSPAPTSAEPSTADAVVDALARSGLETLNPLDTTEADCAVAGCAQSITTDRFRVMSFHTSGAAQLYAANRGLEQVETVVVSFAPPVAQPERQRYWTAITKIVR